MPEAPKLLGLASRLSDRVRSETTRGHFFGRAIRRVLRELQGLATRLVLWVRRPSAGHIAVATLDSSEENASALAAILGRDSQVSTIFYISPEPAIAERAVRAACARLECDPPRNVEFTPLNYRSLLSAYARSRQTYSTHVMLPGTDPTRRRAHVHLTHGSGPKPDRTFRGPTNVLASIVGVWVPAQFRDYGLPSDTPVLPIMPRLEIMRRASSDRSLLSRLGLDPDKLLVIWAPTYRAILRAGNEVRVSGLPFSEPSSNPRDFGISEVRRLVEAQGVQFIAKIHPFDADDYEALDFPLCTTEMLREANVSTYELLGVADLVITDYSSIYTERAALGLPLRLFCPDIEAFEESYRGFRHPHFRDLTAPVTLRSPADLITTLTSLEVRDERTAEDRSDCTAVIKAHNIKVTGAPLTDLYAQVAAVCR